MAKRKELGSINNYFAKANAAGNGGPPGKKQKTGKDVEELPVTGTEADYPWGEEDQEQYPCIFKKEMPIEARGLYCEVCQKAGKGGTWSKQPFRSVRARHAAKHIESEDHKASLRALNTQHSIDAAFGSDVKEKDREVFSALVANFSAGTGS